MIRSQIGQRLLGALFILGCGWFTWSEWQTLVHEGYYHPKAAVLFPLMTLAGVGLLLFPFDYDRLQAEHGVDRVQHFSHMPLIWKLWSLVMIAAAIANWAAMANWR
jgi:hypothetical protein